MDTFITVFDNALRTLFAPANALRTCPKPAIREENKQDERVPLTAAQERHAQSLMRVNHTGEICAQALYTAQALVTQNPRLRTHFLTAAQEETDHLAWTEQRIKELGGRTSLLNPFWYAGAFAIGAVAGKMGGDTVSLAFVVETENQVEAHLASHLVQNESSANRFSALPNQDFASRAIVEQMKVDEAEHAKEALAAGAVEIPLPIRFLMRGAAKVMTTLAYKI
jgi:ubiquinone biosynthesis monooxygenase Coq7